jgi:hypothetical protein
MDIISRINLHLQPASITDSYLIKYIGKPFSLNDIYVSGNQKGAFWKRKNIKDKYSAIFRDLMEESEYLVPFNKFMLCIFYNSRHDVDNIVGMGKVFADTLREKWVPNDNKKHYRGLMIFVDDNLDQNEFDFTIIDKTNG